MLCSGYKDLPGGSHNSYEDIYRQYHYFID